jgi:hypothetical protein
MSILNEGQGISLQEVSQQLLPNNRCSQLQGAEPNELRRIANRGIEHRREIRMNVMQQLNKSSHFIVPGPSPEEVNDLNDPQENLNAMGGN